MGMLANMEEEQGSVYLAKRLRQRRHIVVRE